MLLTRHNLHPQPDWFKDKVCENSRMPPARRPEHRCRATGNRGSTRFRVSGCQTIASKSVTTRPPCARIQPGVVSFLPRIAFRDAFFDDRLRTGPGADRQPAGGRARYDRVVPEISRFFGIVIHMFVEPGAALHRPRFHVYYQDASAIYAIDSIESIGGSLPRTQSRLVEAWGELHREELLKNWELLQSGHPTVPIAPLQ